VRSYAATVSLADLLVLNRSGYWGEGSPTGVSTVPAKVIRNGDIASDGQLRGYAERYLTSREVERARLLVGDIALTTSGDVGKSWLVDQLDALVASNFVRILRPDKRRLLPTYLRYALDTDAIQEALRSNTSGTTIPNLKKSFYEAARFSLPSLPDQERVVLKLDDAFAALRKGSENAAENLRMARAVFDSHLNRLLAGHQGWAERPLADLCNIKHGFAFSGTYFRSSGDWVLLTPGNFYEAGGYRDRGDKQKYFVGPIPREYVLQQGDLLVAMTEQAAGLLGSPAIVPESERFLHNQRLGLVTAKAGVPWSSEFFFHVFNTIAVRKAIHEGASGVKVRHTSPGKIGLVLVSFPTSAAEQAAIADRLNLLHEETQALALTYERKRSALDELRRSVLRQAFLGVL
jgi:type I restriction enzyme S subunit